MSAPNISALTSILGKTATVSSIATGGSTVIASVTASHVFKLNSITVSNKTGTACYVTIYITRSAVNYNIAYQISIPANTTLNVLGRDMGLYLEESDVLTALSQTASALDALASYEDIS
jgi:hypothetical protein